VVNKNANRQVEYEHLKLVLTDDTVEITVFNRGITLFMSEDEGVWSVLQVLCKLDRE